MIGLGKILIKDETSIVEARGKIRLLAEDLKFGPFDATRLATITSELSRVIYKEGEESSVGVGFDKKEGVFGLVLIFQTRKEGLDTEKAEIFFDRVKSFYTKDGFQRVETFRYIPDPKFKPTKEFIDLEREKLVRLSKAELFNEVKRKNKELVKLLIEIKIRAEREKKLAIQAAAAAAEKQRADELEKAKEKIEKMMNELKTLDQLKSDFVSTVSHELRTPLSVMKEGISLVLDKTAGGINEKQEQLLSVTKANIDRLARIIDELLDISKIESGKIALRRELINLDKIIKTVESTFEPKIKEKGIELRTIIPEKGIEIYADKDKLTQIFTNLINNSLKFTEKGYIEIKIKKLENEVELSVADTGIGISKENLPKVFSKFQQFGRVPGPGDRGTGLGLSIVKALVELHKGRIWVESEIGKGTRFVFIVPRYLYEEIFKEHIDRGIKEASEKNAKMSIIVVTLINLNKSIEDVDLLLKDIEDVIKKSLRRTGDIVIKGTEEVIILVDCDKNNVLAVKKRLVDGISEYLNKKGLKDKIRLQFGYATYPDDGMTEEELIKKTKK